LIGFSRKQRMSMEIEKIETIKNSMFFWLFTCFLGNWYVLASVPFPGKFCPLLEKSLRTPMASMKLYIIWSILVVSRCLILFVIFFIGFVHKLRSRRALMNLYLQYLCIISLKIKGGCHVKNCQRLCDVICGLPGAKSKKLCFYSFSLVGLSVCI